MSSQMKISQVLLRAKSPTNVARWCVDHLGMTMREEGQAVFLSYPGDDASLHICQADSPSTTYEQKRNDYFWKIGITLPNVDLAYQKLRAEDVLVSAPHQFEDVGYLCHLTAPEGFTVELLQHTFADNRAENVGDKHAPFSEARVGMITLRIADLDAALDFWQDTLGMSQLSIQPVEEYGFTLYFLAHSSEKPPNSELEALENREWTYQRPYTTLELQMFTDKGQTFNLTEDGEVGYVGVQISGASMQESLLDSGNSPVELIP